MHGNNELLYGLNEKLIFHVQLLPVNGCSSNELKYDKAENIIFQISEYLYPSCLRIYMIYL